MDDETPMRREATAPRVRLFRAPEEEQEEREDSINDVVPINTDLEVLLINSCKIDAIKVQTIVEDFIADKKYTTIFCMTSKGGRP